MLRTITINGIEHYKDYKCHCGCNKKIPYPITKNGIKSHKYRGVPKFRHGHNGFKKGNKNGIQFKKGQCGVTHPRFIDGMSHYGTYSRGKKLNCIPMNKPFEGCEMHHMTKDVVMFIPSWLHENVRHSVKTGYHLEEMNNLAYEWFDKQK